MSHGHISRTQTNQCDISAVSRRAAVCCHCRMSSDLACSSFCKNLRCVSVHSKYESGYQPYFLAQRTTKCKLNVNPCSMLISWENTYKSRFTSTTADQYHRCNIKTYGLGTGSYCDRSQHKSSFNLPSHLFKRVIKAFRQLSWSSTLEATTAYKLPSMSPMMDAVTHDQKMMANNKMIGSHIGLPVS